MFSSAFPGGFAALINQDFIHDEINFSEMVNIDPDFERSYCDHFAYINPWSESWTRMPSGSVFVAERHRPARTFANTEFYNDWLVPQGDVIGGVGLKVDASPTDVIYFPMHYPGRYAEMYDLPAEEVSRRLVGVIERAVNVAGALQADSNRRTALSALIERRGGPAFVVDGTMLLTEANQEAVDLFAAGNLLRCQTGRVSFTDHRLDEIICRFVSDLYNSPASTVSRYLWKSIDASWAITFARLPSYNAGPSALLSSRIQILVLMNHVQGSSSCVDLDGLARHFGLTLAEKRLCASLVRGKSLADAAVELRISHGTARQRVIMIFQKTNTHRQSELCLLLARLSI